jgi:hypothetical protein
VTSTTLPVNGAAPACCLLMPFMMLLALLHATHAA